MALVVGLMSGTSMDGIDACLVEIRPSPEDEKTRDEHDLEMKLLQFLTKPYPPGVREGLARLCRGEGGGGGAVADVCRYNYLLGQLFAEAAQEVVAKDRRSMSDITVIGSHGQTVCHLPQPHPLLHGYWVSSSLQIADPAVIAAWCGVTTVGDFRVADIALGGQGAPLIPYLDKIILKKHYQRTGRVGMLLNVGGISNVTALLPVSQRLIGFDCGPGNVLIDTLMKELYDVEFDKDGETALIGSVSQALLGSLVVKMRDYRDRRPPKSLAKEEFSDEYQKLIMDHKTENNMSREDIIATVTEFTAVMVVEGYERYIRPSLEQEVLATSATAARDLFVSGGGAHNTAIMRSLGERLSGVRVSTSAEVGVDPDAKEAMCFALLAYQTLQGVATNIPGVTGASRPTLLGKICPVSPHPLTTHSTTNKTP